LIVILFFVPRHSHTTICPQYYLPRRHNSITRSHKVFSTHRHNVRSLRTRTVPTPSFSCCCSSAQPLTLPKVKTTHASTTSPEKYQPYAASPSTSTTMPATKPSSTPPYAAVPLNFSSLQQLTLHDRRMPFPTSQTVYRVVLED
jgi:hypothetical protein